MKASGGESARGGFSLMRFGSLGITGGNLRLRRRVGMRGLVFFLLAILLILEESFVYY